MSSPCPTAAPQNAYSQSQFRVARREYTHDVACPVHVALHEGLDFSTRLRFDDPERPSHVPFGVRGVEGFVRGEDRASQSCGHECQGVLRAQFEWYALILGSLAELARCASRTLSRRCGAPSSV